MLTSRIFCLQGGLRLSPEFQARATRFALIAGVGLLAVLAVASSAHAGTGGTEFASVNNRITDMVEGGGGKLAAGLGLVAALAASVIRFNIWAVIGAFGVGAIAGYGLPIVTSSISALI